MLMMDETTNTEEVNSGELTNTGPTSQEPAQDQTRPSEYV